MALVAPEVPVPDTSALQYVARGLAGMMANRRYAQQLELAQQKMVQDQALDQARFDLSRQKMAADFSMDQQRLDLSKQQLSSTLELNRAHTGAYEALAEQRRRIGGTAAEQALEYNRQVAGLQKEAMDRFGTVYKLNDPKFQNDNPIQFAANFDKWEQEYMNAPHSTGIPNQIKDIRRMVDQLKVPLKIGATYDQTNERWVGGKEQNVPAWQVVQKLKDPAEREPMMTALEASGHLKIEEGTVEMGGKQIRSKTVSPDDLIGNWLKMGRDVDFTPQRSRVPAMIAPTSGAYKGTGELRRTYQQQLEATDEEAPLPAPDASAAPASATPTFEPTETDQILGKARAALAAGAPLPALAQRLAQLQIDPNLLFNDTNTLAPSERLNHNTSQLA